MWNHLLLLMQKQSCSCTQEKEIEFYLFIFLKESRYKMIITAHYFPHTGLELFSHFSWCEYNNLSSFNLQQFKHFILLSCHHLPKKRFIFSLRLDSNITLISHVRWALPTNCSAWRTAVMAPTRKTLNVTDKSSVCRLYVSTINVIRVNGFKQQLVISAVLLNYSE